IYTGGYARRQIHAGLKSRPLPAAGICCLPQRPGSMTDASESSPFRNQVVGGGSICRLPVRVDFLDLRVFVFVHSLPCRWGNEQPLPCVTKKELSFNRIRHGRLSVQCRIRDIVGPPWLAL